MEVSTRSVFGFVAALGLALMVALPVAAQEPTPLERRAAGCYAIDFGEWNPPRHEGNAPYNAPPRRIRLSEERGAEMSERNALLLRPTIQPADRRARVGWAHWRGTPTDSLRLVWTNGFLGVTAALLLDGDRLAGEAKVFTDERGREWALPKASVEGRRVACREGDPGRGWREDDPGRRLRGR